LELSFALELEGDDEEEEEDEEDEVLDEVCNGSESYAAPSK
jgi:hypothetical protein